MKNTIGFILALMILVVALSMLNSDNTSYVAAANASFEQKQETQQTQPFEYSVLDISADPITDFAVHTLLIYDNTYTTPTRFSFNDSTALTLICRAPNTIEWQVIARHHVIRTNPENINSATVTLRLDDNAATTSVWHKNTYEYKNIWYRGNVVELAQQIANSSQVVLRARGLQDPTYIISTKTQQNIQTVLEHCSK